MTTIEVDKKLFTLLHLDKVGLKDNYCTTQILVQFFMIYVINKNLTYMVDKDRYVKFDDELEEIFDDELSDVDNLDKMSWVRCLIMLTSYYKRCDVKIENVDEIYNKGDLIINYMLKEDEKDRLQKILSEIGY